ncbi:cation diffusion facilitator family transporter [Desulfolucanica intricata]|uniref:cation diffusion facilitator family transporter n=1 Tax=Desulfolucanica intricata TaxID=1285191 RepID=UPI000A4B08C3|nr:cation diffusion facilitator family transporter [Desulfolucanica intricata]
MDDKMKVARLSIISNSLLTLGKLGVGVYMQSVSVISEAFHSGLDLLAALIAFISVREAGKPADEIHRYGHGKFENLASILEALLIIGAAVLIIVKAVPKLTGEAEIRSLGLGIIVMGVSALVNFIVSSRLMRVAKKTDSPALAADAWHLRTDVYTSLGVFIGIIVIKLTGITIIDPIIAIVVALFILKAAYDLIKESMGSMLDVSLPAEEEKIIHEVLTHYSDKYLEYHRLRTRKSGSQRHVDLHLVVPKHSPITKSHDLCDQIEEELKNKLFNLELLIHVEPCGENCENCQYTKKDLNKRNTNFKTVKDCDKCRKRQN